ncbi:MAG: sigma-70 family RNA polymerase sigma factor [Candidatus Hydrogenedentes bacterium]|nr:sigma-70 family RNA polymerase sigma factor [Candidatus Hydrogenedentota bacterium]
MYDAHGLGVYGYVHAILADRAEAEDVVQDVFLRALARSRGWLGLRNPAGYLYRAARNEALSRLRKRTVRTRAAAELTYAAEVLTPIESSLESAEEAARVNSALLALPVEQREVVVLKVYQNMTFKDIARITGASQNTVASRYRYALAKLKEILEAEEAVFHEPN